MTTMTDSRAAVVLDRLALGADEPDVHAALAHAIARLRDPPEAQVPSYDALLIIAQSVCGALERAGITDCDDPGEAIDVLRERYEAQAQGGGEWPIVDVAPEHSHIPCAKYPDLFEYHLAISGEGDHAYTWSDKPHRLVYNLTSEASDLRDRITDLSAPHPTGAPVGELAKLVNLLREVSKIPSIGPFSQASLEDVIDRLRALAQQPAAVDGVCEWDIDEGIDLWGADCGVSWTFIEGGPAENKLRHCPNCGKPVALAAQPGGAE